MEKTKETFEEIYDATFPALRRMALLRSGSAADAEDLLQNVYAAFYRQLCKKGACAARNPEAYLKTVLKSELSRYYRSKASEPEPIEEYAVLPAEEDLEEQALFRLSVSAVWQSLGEEPPLSQKLFLLRYQYGMRTREIAEALSLTDDVVRARLSRTRRNLVEKLGNGGEKE